MSILLYKDNTFQCMGKIFCVEFQRYPLKLHTKYLIHTLKDVCLIPRLKIKIVLQVKLQSIFETVPNPTYEAKVHSGDK